VAPSRPSPECVRGRFRDAGATEDLGIALSALVTADQARCYEANLNIGFAAGTKRWIFRIRLRSPFGLASATVKGIESPRGECDGRLGRLDARVNPNARQVPLSCVRDRAFAIGHREEADVAEEQKALSVTLAGHSMSVDGRHGILLFKQPNGDLLPLALPIEQVSTLAAATADITTNAQRTLGADAPSPVVLRVERWRITPKPNARIFTFVTQHFEMCFEVTPETVRENG